MSDADKKINLLIKYLDIQLLQQRAMAKQFGSISEYGEGYINALEVVMIAALNIKNEFADFPAPDLSNLPATCEEPKTDE